MKDAVVRAGAEATTNYSDAGSLARLSALIDGALAPADAAPTIDRVLADPALRAAWDEYHLVGDVLRSDDLAAMGIARQEGANRAARFASLLDAEPTVLAPQAQRTGPSRRSNWFRYGLPGASVAAAVAMVSWIAFPQFAGGDSQLSAERGPAAATISAAGGSAGGVNAGSATSGSTTSGPVIAAGAPRPAVDPVQLQEYLSAHRQYSVGVMQAADFGSVAPVSAARSLPSATSASGDAK